MEQLHSKENKELLVEYKSVEEAMPFLMSKIDSWLTDHPAENALVLIAGPTASGKSILTNKLADHYKEATVLSLDRYYFGETVGAKEEGKEVNFSIPSALDAERIAKDVNDLATLPIGTPVKVPIYGMRERGRIGEEEIKTGRILIVEGVYAFLQTPLDTPFRIYIESSPEERLQRKVNRDVYERGMPEDEVRRRFKDYGEPARLAFVESQKEQAAIIVQNPQNKT